MKYSHSLAKIIVSCTLTFFIGSAVAGPGTLVNSPIFVSAAAAPNIMLIFDNSRSMEHVVAESDATDPNQYNSATTYITNCSSPVSTSNNIYIYITGGKPKVRYSHNSGTPYTVDYTAGNLTSGQICFDPTQNYNAGLHATNGTQPEYDFAEPYSGNYLNWYFKFDNTTPKWDGSQRLKPNTETRKTAAETSMTSLLTSLEAADIDLRIGLTAFSPARLSSGIYIADAKIFDEIKYLDTTQRDAIITDLTNLGYGGGTPLARTLHQVGRYFKGDSGSAGPQNGSLDSTTAGINDTNGHYDGDLILHPSTTANNVDSSIIFNTPPQYDSSITASDESPIQYWCQSNFAFVITDGLPTSDRLLPSDLTDYDGDCAACSTPPGYDQKGPPYVYEQQSYQPSDYLDDVAQALFEIDLRPDINDNNNDPVKNNIITYTIAFANQGAITNQLLQDTGPQGGGESLVAGDTSELIEKITDVTYKILAKSSSAAAVTFNTSTLGSDTAVYQAVFSSAIWSGEIHSFPVDPVTGNIDITCTHNVDANCWDASPHLDALAYNTSSSTFLNNRQIITYDPDSTVKKGIAFRAPASYPARLTDEITTEMVKDICAGPDAPELETTPATKAGLCRYTDGVDADTTTTNEIAASRAYIANMVNYIRGDRTYEDLSSTPSFRIRDSVLGDIINSTPVFIGSPPLPWSSTEVPSNLFGVTNKRYSTFKTAQKNRTNVLYVAANDGMLHAFRTENENATPSIREEAGDELFAYMPSFVFSADTNSGYHNLAKNTYSHKYYLDLSLTFSDVFTQGKNADGSVDTTLAWRTVLIGGSRGGDKVGLFALDVTDPDNINETTPGNNVLWEFTNSSTLNRGDPNLGKTYSKPTIALTNVIKFGTTSEYRWAAIFGNGYQDDTVAVTNGSDCHARLFVLFLDGGLDGQWTKTFNDPTKDDYITIDTTYGTTAAGDCNGLSTPALADLDGNGTVDRVYAGDVKGNMWGFDLSCTPNCSSSFKVAHKTGATVEPLFTATDGTNPQPIMVKPSLALNTAAASPSAPNVMVLFGTGKYHTTEDNTASTTGEINSFYGIWDKGDGGLTDDRTYISNPSADTYTLIEQEISSVTNIYGEFRKITSNTIDWTSKYGWFIDLDGVATPDSQERVVVDPAIRSNVIFFNTLVPNAMTCGFGGSGWLMSVDYLTGSATSTSIFDVNGNNVVDPNDQLAGGDIAVGQRINSIPAKSSFIGDYQYTQGSDKGVNKRKISLAEGLKEGRLSWREIRAED